MSWPRRVILVAVVTALLLGAVAAWRARGAIDVPDNLAFSTIDGRRIRIADLHGRPLLVQFWATTCRTCVEEAGRVAALYEQLAPRGFELIAVAMQYDPPNRVVEFARARALRYPIALDLRGEAAQAFGDVEVTPTMFLLAPDGRVVDTIIGRPDFDDLRRRIESMLDQRGGA
ncbi:MAG: TlpA family protein disulfide reductase [Gammaproteobacteria bacterium]